MKAISVSLALLAAGAISTQAIAQNIMGSSKIVTVTSTIPVGNSSFPLSQIADGIANPALPFNGFQGQENTTGLIAFTLDQTYDITGIHLWNDINVQAEGVKTYKLNFYDAANNLVGTKGPFNVGASVFDPQPESFAPVVGVRRVEMVIESIQTSSSRKRVEIREVAFEGTVSLGRPETMKGDHYQCYRIPESNRLPPEAMQVGDQFGRTQIVLGRPVTICNPSTKVHGAVRYGVGNPERHLVCYDIVKQSENQRRRKVRFNNQMAPGEVVVAERQTFCVPSSKKLLGEREVPLEP